MKLRAAASAAREDSDGGEAGGAGGAAADMLPPPSRRQREADWRVRLAFVLTPLAALTLLLLLDALRRRGERTHAPGLHFSLIAALFAPRRAVTPAPHAAAGGTRGGWLHAASSRGTKAEWYASVADMVGWKLADWEIALRSLSAPKARPALLRVAAALRV
jgi:hypothetical protein